MGLYVGGQKVGRIKTIEIPPIEIPREVDSNGVYGFPVSNFSFKLPDEATDLGASSLSFNFFGCTSLTSVDLSSLSSVSGSDGMFGAFWNCTSLTSVDLSSLTSVSGDNGMSYSFYGCTSIASVDLSSLTSVSGRDGMYSTFYGCSSLVSVDLSSLITIGTNSSSTNFRHFSQAFYNCNYLTSLSFPLLEEIYCTGTSSNTGTFYNNNKIQKMYFPKLHTVTYGSGATLSNQVGCKNIFYDCSSLTELHFGAVNQAAIEASPGYSTAWGRGAGNVSIYFDL